MTACIEPPRAVHELVRNAAGLRVRERDIAALSSWTAERVRALALPGIERYGPLLAENSAAGRRERELLTVQFTTGESHFFRDNGQFDLLAATILPELIERRAAQRTLRLWSAGCAAGEEAYSLAMLVEELAPRLAGWDLLVLGTDINSAALEKARCGEYGEWSFRTLDEARRQRFFHRRSKQWLIDSRLRGMVTFRSGDLIRDPFPDPKAGLAEFDLILCRNVFIYLDAQAVACITAKFSDTLADGGYLVTGHSELFGHDTAPLRVRMFPQSAVFQKPAAEAGEIGLGEALSNVPVPAVAALAPAPCIARDAPRAEARAVSSLQSAAPAENCDRLMQSARRCADRGMPAQAERECRKALAIAAFDPRPYYLLAQLAQERGDAVEARILLKKVIYLDASFIAACLDLGALHAQAGENERTRRMFETARAALSKLPAQAPVPPYRESTAADILAYLGRMLDAPDRGSAGSATAGRRLHRSA